jgi:hypothetical protein
MKIGDIIVRKIDNRRFKVVFYDAVNKLWMIDDLDKDEEEDK